VPGRPRRSPLSLAGLAILAGLVFLALLRPAAAAGEPAPPVPVEAVVRVHERAAFTLKAERAGQSAAERARAASQALDTVVDLAESPEARIEEKDGVAVVFVGKTPIVTLGEVDVAASGETLHVYASSIAARAQDAVRAEETRSSIASTVFSVSLLVFSGLIAFLLFRRVGDFSERARTWVRENPRRIPALRLGRIEVIRPNAIRGGVNIALGLASLIGQLAVGYGWLLFALSLFAATRDYTERLTGFVLAPLWALIGRIGSALPVVVVASVAALAVGVLVRFVALFFESVAEGNTSVGWLSRDLAAPTSVLARAGIIVVALVLAAPLLTGTDDGALSKVGVAVLFAIGLSSTPVVACVVAGIPVVFGRRLVAGDFVEVGGHAGRVKDVSLLAVTLEGGDGSELRIPHLMGLVRATRVIGSVQPVAVDITIDAREPQGRVRGLLMTIAGPYTTRTKVELVSLDGDGARYRVSGCQIEGAGDLASALADKLREENVALGRARADARP
jgi:small-conductance mechanosensitive channel